MTQTHSISGGTATVSLSGELDSHTARDCLLYIAKDSFCRRDI